MAKKEFLNPAIRALICAIGMIVMGYFIMQDLNAPGPLDRVTYVRIAVFGAFAYFLIRTFTKDGGRADSPDPDSGRDA
jgi:hypothetical protein